MAELAGGRDANLWVLTTRDGQLRRIHNGAIVLEAPLVGPGNRVDLSLAGNRPVAVDHDTRVVSFVDPATGRAATPVPVPATGTVQGAAFDGDHLWMALTEQADLLGVRGDGHTLTVEVGHAPLHRPEVEAGHVYAFSGDGTVRHLAERGLENVTVAATLDELAHLRGSVDLVNSVLVLQHIRPNRGLDLFEQLVGLLAPGGCGAVQFFLGRDVPWWRQAVGTARQRYRAVNVAANLARGRLTTEALPYEMNVYHLTHVYPILDRAGITEMWIENYFHADGVYSTLYFTRGSVEPTG